MIINHPHADQEAPLRSLWQAAFGDPDAFLDAFFQRAYAPERCLGVWEDGQLLGAVYWFACACRQQKLAYLYALAVEKSCRGRGIGTQLMEKAHAVLASQGYAGAVLVPQEERLWGLYARLDYREGPGIETFTCKAGDTEIPLRAISAAEYATLRRMLLPVGGVVQEGENLAFLETQADFWAGADCILATRQEEDQLFGLELLGDTQSAPGIVAALGCREGIFRVPGTGRFAMFRPLREDCAIPHYFGFAFD